MRSFSILCAASTLLSAVSGSPIVAELGNIVDASKKGQSGPPKWSSSSPASSRSPPRTSSSSHASRTASKDFPKQSSSSKGPGFPHHLPEPTPVDPTPPCTPSSTNYLVNPGFDDITGDIFAFDPWTFSGDAAAVALQSYAHSAPNSFGASADTNQPVDGTLFQVITLPEDTVFPFVVTCDGYFAVEVTNDDITGTMEMYVNDELCGSATASTFGAFSRTPFVQITPQGTGVTITDPFITVEVRLRQLSAQAGKIVYVDSFALNREFTCPLVDVDVEVAGLEVGLDITLP